MLGKEIVLCFVTANYLKSNTMYFEIQTFYNGSLCFLLFLDENSINIHQSANNVLAAQMLLEDHVIVTLLLMYVNINIHCIYNLRRNGHFHSCLSITTLQQIIQNRSYRCRIGT